MSAAPTAAWGISRRIGVAVGTLGAALVLGGASPTASLKIDVEKLRSSKGVIQLCLTADPENFPSCVDDARALSRKVPAGQRTIRVEGLPHGNYAAAIIHDENGNNKLDTMMGIPREGFGFSRNPAIGFGPPRFTAARFAVEGSGTTQDIRVRYLL